MQTKDNESNNLKRQQQQKELDKIDHKESSLNPNLQQPNNGLIDPATDPATLANLPAPDSFYGQDSTAGTPTQSPPSVDEFTLNSFPSNEISFNLFEAPNADSGNFFTRRTLRKRRIPIVGKQEEDRGLGDSS